MATLSLTKNYADSTLLLADDFDVFLDELETFLNITKLNDDNIQDDGITASNTIQTASITTAKILNNAVITAKIADEGVTTAKILDANVTTAKILDANVTTAKIADSAVTTAKILDANVTRAKLRTVNYAVSSATSSSAAGSGLSLVTTVSITTTGRPVLLMLESATGSSSSYIELGSIYTAVTAERCRVHGVFYRDASVISYSMFASTRHSVAFPPYDSSYQANGRPATIFTHIDSPAAGTYTYSFYFNSPLSSQRIKWENVRLVAVEL